MGYFDVHYKHFAKEKALISDVLTGVDGQAKKKYIFVMFIYFSLIKQVWMSCSGVIISILLDNFEEIG